jgi:hypothetical protein
MPKSLHGAKTQKNNIIVEVLVRIDVLTAAKMSTYNSTQHYYPGHQHRQSSSSNILNCPLPSFFSDSNIFLMTLF